MKRLFFALLLFFCVSVEMFADAVKLPGEGVTPTEYLQQMGIEAENYTWTNSTYCKWLQGQTFDFRMHVPEPPLVSVALYYYGNDGTGIWYDFDDHEFFVPFKRSADNSTISITLDPESEYLYHGAFDSIVIIRLNFYPYKQEDAPLGHDVRNRIKNADFEEGNVEFTSAYNYVEPGTGKLNPEGNYTVDNGLRGNHTIQEKCNSDHTTGKGKFFMANGGSDENTIVLEQHVSPLFDKSYRYLAFSAWVLNWSYPPYAQLQWYVDGQPLGRSELANTRSCEWKRIGTIWTNEKELNEIVLSLRNMQTGKSGNDFAVDDLFFGPVRVQARLDRIILGKKTPTPDTIKIDVCGEDAPTLDDVKKIVWEKCNVTDADLEYPSDAAIRVAMNSGGEITIKKSKEDCDFPADFQGWCSCVTYPEKIIIVNYKVAPTEFTEYTINTCMGATNYKCPWKSSKYTYFTEQGIYYDTIKSYLGCDSLYCKAIVTEKGPVIRNLDTTVCWEDRTGWYSFDVDHNIFLWYIDGQKYHMIPSFDKEYERDEIKTVKNEAGCDSVVYYLHAKWNKAKNIPETIEMCPGKPVYYLVDTGYLEITAPGHYTVELSGPGGANCPDKWDLTVKTFSGVSEVNVNEITCPGTDVTVYPYSGRYGSKAITFENVTKSGLYRDTLRSVWGCDSVIAKINIQVAYAKDTTVYDTICRSHLPTSYFGFRVNQVRSDTVYNLPEILKKEKYFNGSKITTAECTTKVYHLHLHVVECDTIYQDTTVVFGSVVKWIPDPTRPSQYEYFRVNENEFTKEYGVYDGARGCQTKHYILRVHAYEKANVNTINATICDGDSYTWKRGSGLADSVITPEQYRPYLRSTKVLEFMETVPTDNPKNPIYYYLNLTIQQAVDNPTVHDTICEGETYVWDKGYSVSEYTEMIPSFSINAEGGKVALAPGNLQYCPARDEWRFAERQFDRCLASDNGTVYWNDGGYQKLCDNLAISPTYGGWVDLFAWGTSGKGQRVGDKHTRYFYPYDILDYDWATYRTDPYNSFGFGPSFDPKFGGSNVWGAGALSNDIDTNSGTNRYFDWGYANEIKEKGKTHKPGTWRTLTLQEWNYLISEREVDGQKNACSYVRLQYGDNATDTVSGVILYPDDFSFARVGVTSIRFGHNDIVVDAATWAKLEKAGCVFLPCTGFVNLSIHGELSTSSDYNGIELYYHTSTIHSAYVMYFVYLNTSTSLLDYQFTERNGIFAVRLARDITGNETVEDDGEHASETINMEEGFTEQDYYDTLRSPAGCDLIRSHLHLVVQKSRSNEDHVVLCHNQSTYTWRGKTFEPSFGLNIYRDTVFGSTGCDNEYYIMNAYRRTREDNENRITMCTNSMYKWYTSDPTSPIFIPSPTKDTTYEDFLAYSDGQCDSIRYLLHIKLIKPETKEKYDTICGSETYEWVTSSKNYPRVIHPTTSDTTYRDTLFSSEGCDSIYYILHLKSYIVDRRPPQYDTICNECGPCARKVYSWDRGDGRPPKPVRIDGQDNTYRDTLRYKNGCDSVYFTLHLCNLITKKEQAIETVCSDEKIYNWYTEGGDFLERIEVKDGTKYYQRTIPFSFTSSCDSLICRLELTHYSVYDTIMYDTICNKEEYEWGRYDSKNYKYEKIRDIRQTTPFEVYRDTIRGASGCDSIITTLKLTRLTSRIEEDTVSLCEGDTYDWYTANKDVVHLNVGAHTQQSADTTYMHRISYTGATSSVCDSVNYRLHVHINFATKRDTTDTILLGQSYSWTTKSSTPTVITPKTAGLIPYSDNAFYTNGCDSVTYILNLLVQKDSFVYLADTVCAGEKYHWTTYTGHTIDIDQTTTFGDYYDTVFHAGSKRLDSIRYHLHLFRQDYKEKHDTVVLCSNESYTWKYGDKSKLIEAPTTPLTKSTWSEYDDVLSYSDRHHCDSVRCTLHVLRHAPADVKAVENLRMCVSALPYTWQPSKKPIKIEDAGDYSDTIKYTRGDCDSVIYRLHLDIIKPITEKLDTFACEGNDLSWYDKHAGRTRSWTNVTEKISDTVKIKTKDGLCDSIYSVVNINPINSETQVYPDTTLCYGDVFEWRTWRSQEFTLDDRYSYPYTFEDDFISDASGCTGTHYSIKVNVDRPTYEDIYDTVCGSSYTWKPSPAGYEPSERTLNSSDVYEEVFKNARGCASLVYRLHLEIRDTRTEELVDTICGDVETYEWKNKAGELIESLTIPLNEGYNDTKTFKYKTGSSKYQCDSVVYKLKLHRMLKTKHITTDTLCNASMYEWKTPEGELLRRIPQTDLFKQYTHSIPYSTYPSCDSVYYELNLHRLVTKTVPKTDVLCGGDEYIWYYDEADKTKFEVIKQQVPMQDHTHIVPFTGSECDSVIYTLNLLRTETVERTGSKTLCYNDEYSWYTSDLTRPCRVIKSSEIVASDTIFRDTLRCTRFPTCDSIHYILNVHVTRRNTYDTIDTVAINEMYYWYTSDKTNPSKSIYATEAGLQPYEDKVYDANGCEIAHYKLNLLVQGYTEDLKTDTVCAGQEYLWTTKDASNPIRITPTEFEKTYYDTAFYVGSKRIDSVRYVLHLICQSPRVYHDTDYVCSSDVYFWNVGGEEIAITPTEEKEDHTKKLYYTGSKGCDSVIYNLHLIRLDYKEVPLHAKVCFGSVYQWYSDKREFLRNIRQQQQDGEYHEVAYYSGSKRCDSVRYTLYLHVDTVKHELDEATFCKDETYRWLDRNGRLLRQINQTTDAQYYSYISYYSNSCDSIYHTLHLSRLYPSDSITNAVICHGESFNWYGTDYTTPTSETQVLPNSVNCDSLCVLNLSVCSEATEKNLDTIICPNHIVEWRGKILSETGVYRDTLRNKYGCDSIIYIMNAVQHDTTNSMESATLCYQELPYLWHYRYCYEPGIYTDTLLNAQGCDSICYLNLSVSEMIDYCIVDTQLCLNHTIEWHDSIIITERGIYYDTLFNVRGCDSVYFILNVDTVDCCTHLENLRLRPLQDVCADDTILNYIFQYTAGLPDSFSVRFKNPDNLELYAKFRDTTGHFALKNINDTWSELPLNKPYLERPRYIRPTGYRVYLDITDTCGTRYQYPFTDSISVYYPHWIIDQHWNDVLALFNSDYNDGYEFSYYQWYRDNEPIFGATRDHYYFPANLSETSDYRALLTRSDDGYTTFTCPVKIVSVADESVLNDQYIYVHPTVVPKDNPTVQIISNLNGNYWIYDMAGKMLSSGGFKSYDETKAATLVTLPAIQSAYFIYLVPDEKRVIKDRSYIILVR